MGYIATSRRGMGKLRGRGLGSGTSSSWDDPSADISFGGSLTPNVLNLPGNTPLVADPDNAAIAAYQASQYPNGDTIPTPNDTSIFGNLSIFGSGSGTGLTSAVPWYVWAAAGVAGVLLVLQVGKR